MLLTMVLLSAGGAVGTVAANDCRLTEPEQLSECENPGDSVQDLLFSDMLDNIYDFAKATLQYAGFVAVFAGVTLWFSTSSNSDRGQVGVWLTVGGLAMIIMYFGFSSLIGLARYVAEGS
jgi:hypothetical protein